MAERMSRRVAWALVSLLSGTVVGGGDAEAYLLGERVGPSGRPIIYIGVVLHGHIGDAHPDTPWAECSKPLEQALAEDRADIQNIIDHLGRGAAYRSGVAYDVQLVVQVPIAWKCSQGGLEYPEPYNFERYTRFAEMVREMGVAWTPLLAYHYAPLWVVPQTIRDFGWDPRIVNSNGETLPSGFLPFSPSSPVWSTYAITWTREAMRALAPYFGNPINAVLCGNEVLYERWQDTTWDYYTQRAWYQQYPGLLYESYPLWFPMYRFGFPTPQFFDFRSREWASHLRTLVQAAQSEAAGRVPVSTKLVPYAVRGTEVNRTGVFPRAYELLDSLDFVGIDTYPPTEEEFQAFHRRDKTMYLAEFNKNPWQPRATRQEVLHWITRGVTRYNLRFATWYCWDCEPDEPGQLPCRLFDTQTGTLMEEAYGLRDAIDWATGNWVWSGKAWILGPQSPIPPASNSVNMQLSTVALGKGWMIDESSADRHRGASILGRQMGPGYEVDWRARSADVNIVDVTAPRDVGSFATRAIYLFQAPNVTLTASGQSAWADGASGNSTGILERHTSTGLWPGYEVFHWTPGWDQGGIRRVNVQGVGFVRWVRSYDGVAVAGRASNSFFIAQDTLWAAGCRSGEGSCASSDPVQKLVAGMVTDLTGAPPGGGGGTCGNSVCDSGEDSFNCPGDCGSGGSCGDGFCDVWHEECSANCPQDCTSGEICQ